MITPGSFAIWKTWRFLNFGIFSSRRGNPWIVRVWPTWYYFMKYMGSQVGVVVITRTSHLYKPGSNPGVRMWAEICPSLSDSEDFSPGTPVFLPPWGCAPRSCMVRIAAARGAYICFWSDLVELYCLCTLRRWWAESFFFFSSFCII